MTIVLNRNLAQIKHIIIKQEEMATELIPFVTG